MFAVLIHFILLIFGYTHETCNYLFLFIITVSINLNTIYLNSSF